MKLFTESKTRYSTFSDQLEKAKESASSISKSTTILKNTFIKRSKLKRKSYLNQQKKEKIKKEKTQRSVKERQLEKPSVGFKNFLGSTGSKIKQASGNVFEAIMYLLIGWLVNKLPEIIDGVKKIYGRIKKIVNVLKSFINNVKNWFVGIGDVVNQAKENFKNFDFFDSKGKLKEKLDELENSWKAIETDIKEGKKLLTTPLSDEDLGDKQTSSGDLFDVIASGEGDYNSVNRGRAGDSPGGASRYFGKDLTQMTVGEVMDLQRSGQLYAAGKYQIIPKTMKGFVSSSSISMTDLFDSSTQEKFKKYITDVKRPAVGQYLRGESENKLEAAQELAREFASIGLAYPEAGRQRGESRYSGTGGNKASISPESIEAALERSRKNKGGGNGQRKMDSNRFFGVGPQGKVIGRIGSTGHSYGPHLHIETGDGYGGAGGYIPQNVLNNIIVDGKPLSGHTMGDGLGAGRNHRGFDYPIRSGAPITLKGDLKLSEYDSGYNAGYGNSIIITDGNGRQYLLGHLSSGPEGIIPIKSGTDAMSIQPFSRQGVNQPPRKSRRKVIVMVEENDMTPQIIQGSGGSSQIVVINPLNSFIKNQLLLDLAYT